MNKVKNREDFAVRGLQAEPLVLLFGVIMLLMIWLVAGWQIAIDQQTSMDAVKRDGDQFSRAFEEHVRRVLSANDEYMEIIKNEYESSYQITPSIERLVQMLAKDRLIVQLALVDAQGRALVSLFPYPETVDFSSRAQFNAHRRDSSDRMYIGEPFRGRVSSRLSIPLSRRLANPDGSFAGIVYVTVDPEYFTKFYRDMNLTDGHIVRLAGLDGVVRASNVGDELGISIAASTMFQNIAESPQGFYRSIGQFMGKHAYINYRVMPDYPLAVQFGVLEESLYSLQQRRGFYIAAALVAALVVIGSCALLLIRLRRQRQAEELLRQSEAKYYAAFKVSPDSIAINRAADGLYLDINNGFTQMTGYSREDVIGKTSLELGIWADLRSRLDMLEKLQQMQPVINVETKFRRKDQTLLYGLLSAQTFVMGNETWVLTIVRDVTKLMAQERQLRENNQQLEAAYEELAAAEEEQRQQLIEVSRNWQIIKEKDAALWALFNNMHDGFALHEIIYDDKGQPLDYRFLAVNKAFVQLLGLSEAQLLGKTVLEVMDDRGRYLLEIFEQVAVNGQAQSVTHYDELTGRCYFLTVYSPQPGQFAVLIIDITEQKEQEETIWHLAYHDSLTGLPNRRRHHAKIEEVLKEAQQQQQRFALMFLDLNNFKQINDSFGHAVGDEFLREVAQRLRECVNEGEYIARMGGDEFAVIVPGTDETEKILEISSRIIETIRLPWEFAGNMFQLGTSIGVAFYPQDGDDADTLLKCADMAMYMAKHLGDNEIYFYTPDLQMEVLGKIAMEHALKQALDRQEFLLHYQPQMDRKGQVIGVEALLRWQHPTRGLLYPGDFLEIAEKIGMMVPIGEWVLKTACTQSMAWQKSGHPPIIMAVNISAAHYQSRSFLPAIQKVLEETGLPARLLEIEITETVAMTNAELTNEITNSLQAMGVRQALDDFGTGYSSLKYLKLFNIDTLKIDKVFIQDVIGDADSDAIVKAIMALSENLQLEVIAEGVENQEQLTYLEGLRCPKMQGYYFSKPVAAKDMEKMFGTLQQAAGDGDITSIKKDCDI